MNTSDLSAKWSLTGQGELGAKGQFADLCRMLGYPTPIEADPAGKWYAFENGAEKDRGRRRLRMRLEAATGTLGGAVTTAARGPR